MAENRSPLLDHAGNWLEVRGFPERGGWRAGFTTLRAQGGLDPILAELGWEDLPVFRLHQVHGTRIHSLRHPAENRKRREGDGLSSGAPGLVMAVAAADCVPMILFDAAAGAGSVLHSGWRGTAAGLARAGVRELAEQWGGRPERVAAVIGPAIGPCCYEVGSEVLEAFRLAGHRLDGIAGGIGRPTLDLPEANRRLLLEAGVPADSIRMTGLCTRCRGDLFPSYRRDGPGCGRLLAFLGAPAP